MQYLKIENPGQTSPEAFTTLGVSLTRFADIPGSIGEKGSGSKHGVLVLMRDDINPIIFCGTLGLEYYSKPMPLSSGETAHDFNLVYYRIKGKDASGKTVNREEKTSYTLEYGATDWPAVSMAMREFVSNALDHALAQKYAEFGHNLESVGLSYIKDVVIDVVDESQVRAKAGYTRVFIPLVGEVQRFYSDLGKWFLHFSEPHLLSRRILPKGTRNSDPSRSMGPVIYRNGVRVREIPSCEESLFDYNFGSDLHLDESRNIDNYQATTIAAKELAAADPMTLARIFQAMAAEDKCWETSLEAYGLRSWSETDEVRAEKKQKWTKALEIAAGTDAVLCPDIASVRDALIKKGKKPIVVKSEGWRTAANELHVPTDANCLTDDDKRGTVYTDAPAKLVAIHDRVWDTLVKYEMTAGKEKPAIRCFSEVTDGGSVRTAFYRDGVCYFNAEIGVDGSRTLMNVIEETAHHTTGAADFTRDFQDYFLRLAARVLMEQWGE